jgi:hypothetical protein
MINLTEKDIRRFMKDLMLQDSYQPRDIKTGRFIKGKRINKPQREFVVYCGTEFKNQFDQAMKNTIK